eukprot:5820690-Prymnesium_polylepis.1
MCIRDRELTLTGEPAPAPPRGVAAWDIDGTISPPLAPRRGRPITVTATSAAASSGAVAQARAAQRPKSAPPADGARVEAAPRVVRKAALDTARPATARPPPAAAMPDDAMPARAAGPSSDSARGASCATERLQWASPSSQPLLPERREAARPLSAEEREEAKLWM